MASRAVAAAAAWLLFSCAALAQAPPTPFACGGSTTVATGGAAVSPLANSPATTILVTNGGYINNGPTATDQGGIANAEAIYVDPTPIVGGAITAGYGTTVAIQPGQSWVFPPGVDLSKLTVNAASSGHKFSCARW